MNHFYTDKLTFFRNARFVFQQEVNNSVEARTEKPKEKTKGEPIKGNESPTSLAFEEARAGKDAIGKGGNELLALQGPEGLRNALDAAKKNPVDAFIKFRKDMPNSPDIREAIGEQLAKRNPDIFLANARFFEKTSGYSKYLETAVTNLKLSPACALAFAKVYEGQSYYSAVTKEATKRADDRTVLSYSNDAIAVARAAEKDPYGARRYT